jgi:putative spermidine/putrescine transport system substrate-binding protein
MYFNVLLKNEILFSFFSDIQEIPNVRSALFNTLGVIGLGLSLVVGTAVLGTAGDASARDLTVVAYGGPTQAGMDTAWFKPFTAATGKPIVQDEDPSLAKVRAMVQSGNVTWDLLDQEQPDAIAGCEEGIFETIDYSKFDTSRLDKSVLGQCGIGMYTAGNVLAYDADKLKDPPKTWADFWNVTKWPGKRGFWFTPKGALEFALLADGVMLADIYKVLRTKEGVDRAFKKLDELKPNILWWKTGGELINRLASGEYTMTMAWNGRISAANQNDKRHFKIAWTAGFTEVTDQWVIVKGTPNLDEAYALVKFALEPDPQAEFMRHVAYSAANTDAYPKLDATRLAELPLSPDNAPYGVAEDVAFWSQNLDSLTQRFNAWASQ